MQITFLRGQQRPVPVDLDAAAFEHKRLSANPSVEQPTLQQPGRRLRNVSVELPGLVFGPAIEMKVHDGRFRLRNSDLWLLSSDKNRPGVARPTAIGRMHDELHALQIAMRAPEV